MQVLMLDRKESKMKILILAIIACMMFGCRKTEEYNPYKQATIDACEWERKMKIEKDKFTHGEDCQCGDCFIWVDFPPYGVIECRNTAEAEAIVKWRDEIRADMKKKRDRLKEGKCEI